MTVATIEMLTDVCNEHRATDRDKIQIALDNAQIYIGAYIPTVHDLFCCWQITVARYYLGTCSRQDYENVTKALQAVSEKTALNDRPRYRCR